MGCCFVDGIERVYKDSTVRAHTRGLWFGLQKEASAAQIRMCSNSSWPASPLLLDPEYSHIGAIDRLLPSHTKSQRIEAQESS